jgi:two-component system chemotaxis response regulator CheY
LFHATLVAERYGEKMINKKIRVLVVDDSAMFRNVLSASMAAPDIEVIGTAFDAFDAKEKIISMKPDVITLDVTMPVMDGLETARNLVAMNPDVNIILLSAMGDEVLLNEAREIGVKHFLTKPFKPDALKEKLAEIFGK